MTRRYEPAEGLRLIFFAVLGLWLLFPVIIRDNLAQDALPYVVAGEMVGQYPDAIYASEKGDLFTLRPEFGRRSCELAPPGTDCANLTVAFVSTPPAIPLAVLVSRLGADVGVLLMRLLGAMCLSGGMWVLWQRLAHRTPKAGSRLVATALLLTPFVMVPTALGQTSPVLFLSACLGVTRSDRSRRQGLLAAFVWVLAVALKAFPAALVVVLLWQRRWRFLLWSAGLGLVLAVLTVFLAPMSVWGDFIQASGELAGQADWNPYNGSIDALVHNLAAPITDSSIGALVLMALRLALAAAVLWWVRRRADDDTQWAVAGLVVLLVVPLVWWHYLWVAIAAIGVTLAGRRRLDDKLLWILPAAAAITIPISIPNGRGWSIPVAQGLFLLVAVAVVVLLTREPDGASDVRGTLEGA